MANVENFPSNSREPKAQNEEKLEKKPILKVVEGDVIRRKKPLRARVREMFIADDSKGVIEYIVEDVLVPSFKDMINEAVSQGMERLIFGGEKTKRTPTRSGVFGSNQNRVNYSRYSSDSSRREPSRPRSRSSHDFDDIIIPTRSEAEAVLEELQDMVSKYDVASVRNLYELVGIDDFHHVDEKWGWSDLRDAHIRRIGNSGYMLKLPPTEPID